MIRAYIRVQGQRKTCTNSFSTQAQTQRRYKNDKTNLGMVGGEKDMKYKSIHKLKTY